MHPADKGGWWLVSTCLEMLRENWVFFLVAIFVGVWYIANIGGAMWVDEAYYADASYNFVTGRDINLGLNRPPLLYYFMGVSQILLGAGSFATRLPVVIFSLLTLCLLYVISKTLSNAYVAALLTLFVSTTRLFAELGTQAMHDVPLLFFILLAFYMVAVRRGQGSPSYFATGVIFACSVIAKESGIFWTAILAAYLLWSKGVKLKVPGIDIELPVILSLGLLTGLLLHAGISTNISQLTDFESGYITSSVGFPVDYLFSNINSIETFLVFLVSGVLLGLVGWFVYNLFKQVNGMKYVPIGFFAAFIVIYLPFTWNIPYAVVRPVAMDLLYNSTVVYEQTGPVWYYIAELVEMGGFSYAAFGVLALLSVRKTEIGTKEKLVIALALLPLLLLSFMRLKSARYMLVSVMFLDIFLFEISHKFLNRIFSGTPKVTGAILLSLVFLPFAPIYGVIGNPSVGADSGFDIAASMVVSHMTGNNLTVASWWDYALGYYLKDVDVEIIKFWDGVVLDMAYNRLVSDDIDLVLMPEGMDLLYPDSKFLKYLYKNYVSREQVGDHNLYLYSM